jgi:broad specificity phosphatase PhoE
VTGSDERVLLLVRHAEPLIDPRRPAPTWGLTARGRRAAASLGRRLADRDPGACFSSPEPKAIQTAGPIAAATGLDVAVLDALREHDRRSVPFFDEPDAFRRAVLDLFERPAIRVFGEESADEAETRFRAGVESAMGSTDAATVVVVAHGTVMSLYAARRTGRPAAEIWSSLGWGARIALPWIGRDPGAVVEPIELHRGE